MALRRPSAGRCGLLVQYAPARIATVFVVDLVLLVAVASGLLLSSAWTSPAR